MSPPVSRTTRVLALYFLLAGGFGILLLLLGVGPQHNGFLEKSQAYKFGAYGIRLVIDCAFVLTGVLIWKQRPRAISLAVVAALVAIVYGGSDFAWGFAGGQPSSKLLIFSYAAYIVWYLCVVAFLFRSSRSTLNPTGS